MPFVCQPNGGAWRFLPLGRNRSAEAGLASRLSAVVVIGSLLSIRQRLIRPVVCELQWPHQPRQQMPAVW